jgi:hypothetical protein
MMKMKGALMNIIEHHNSYVLDERHTQPGHGCRVVIEG